MWPIHAHLDGVRGAGSFTVEEAGRWEWTIEAWSDAFATWREELRRKLAFGQHGLSSELLEGVVLLRDAVPSCAWQRPARHRSGARATRGSGRAGGCQARHGPRARAAGCP